MVQNNVESSGLSYDPRAAIRHLGEADATLRDLMVEIGGFDLELRSEQTPFEALLRSIVYQQLSGHAAGSILNRMLAMYGDVYPEPQQLLNTSEDELRACGLSRSKIRAARDLAKRTANGLLPNSTDIASMDDDQIVDAFVTVFGIGPWTVEMLLIFHLGRPDVCRSMIWASAAASWCRTEPRRCGAGSIERVWRTLATVSKRRQLVFVARRRPAVQSRRLMLTTHLVNERIRKLTGRNFGCIFHQPCKVIGHRAFFNHFWVCVVNEVRRFLPANVFEQHDA